MTVFFLFSIIDFFEKLQKWVDMANMSRKFQDQVRLRCFPNIVFFVNHKPCYRSSKWKALLQLRLSFSRSSSLFSLSSSRIPTPRNRLLRTRNPEAQDRNAESKLASEKRFSFFCAFLYPLLGVWHRRRRSRRASSNPGNSATTSWWNFVGFSTFTPNVSLDFFLRPPQF